MSGNDRPAMNGGAAEPTRSNGAASAGHGLAALDRHPVFDPGILRGFHLLEADAGTGKTWTISGLVTRALVEQGLGIDRILVVTFTRAATAELSRRIRERIEALARAVEGRIAGREGESSDPFCAAYLPRIVDPQAALRRLRVALAQIDEAQVRTIHGFCHGVIDEHAMSIGIAQGLQAQSLGSQWIERGVAAWWREMAGAASPQTLALLRATGVSPRALVEPVRAIDARPAAIVLPSGRPWRELADELSGLRSDLADALVAETDALRRWLSVKGQFDGRRWRDAWLVSRLAALSAFCRGEAAKGGPVPDEVEKFTSGYFRGGNGGFPVPPLRIVALCDRLDALRAELVAVPALVAIEAARQVCARRMALKAQAGAIDHDDLLRIVREALARAGSGPALAASLRERYPLALIDECQDTDALQWEIFRAIYRDAARAGDAGLVLVGDPKQAIYAFRGADVYSYLDARVADPRRHALHENQRSLRPLIESVNALLDRDVPFLVPEIEFAPSREGARPRASLGERAIHPPRAPMTVVALDGAGEGAMLPRARARSLAVRACVAEISRLLQAGQARIDGRPLEPRDIAVLVNSHAEGSLIRRELARAGIGAAEISRDSVLESRECDELLRVVAAVADPSDASLLKSALATALLDRPDEALGRVDAYASVQRFAQARSRWAESGPHAALAGLFEAMQAAPRLARLRDGERRLTNLAHLLELLAGSAQAREGARPALDWLVQMRQDPRALGDEVGELRLDSDEDLVRIVTVHKSKGLEYPIVFLPFAWSAKAFSGNASRRGADGPAALAYHRRVEGADDRADDRADDHWRAVLDFTAERGSEAWAQAAREYHAETLRTLYVALTRAEQRCYLFWGAAAGAQFSALAWLLDGLDPASQSEWRVNGNAAPALDEAAIADGLDRWRDSANARCPDALVVIGHESLVASAGAGQAAAAGAVGSTVPAGSAGSQSTPTVFLRARPFAGSIPSPWLQTSFTSLAAAFAAGEAPSVAESRSGAELPDHDQHPAAGPSPEADASAASAGTRFAFPAGAQAGTCLHGILEQTDLASPLSDALVASWLARSGFEHVEAAEVARWLDEVLDTPLPDLGGGPLSLRGLAPARTVREMEFLLCGSRVPLASVFAAIAGEFPLELRAAQAQWSGYLRGFIDLVFEAGGRYYLLDWKSNRLGPDWSDYESAAMRASVAEHAYALQYCVYTLALHRLLRSRLADYDPARHLGGVYYLFLRAVQPDRRGADGLPTGIHAVRPSVDLVDRLDRLFAGTR